MNLTNQADIKHIYHPFKATFEGLKQQSGAILIFRDCNLSQISFGEAELSRMEFDRVFWPIFRNRTVLYDELVLRENLKNPDPLLLNLPSYIAKRCESVERLYRQLKSNYEEKKDYKRVGDFHYGEMEMHRLGSPWRRRFPFSWYNLYWALNGYGERPLRALTWFVFFLFAFTGLIWSQGLTVTDSAAPPISGSHFALSWKRPPCSVPPGALPSPAGAEFLASSQRPLPPRSGRPLLPGLAQPPGPPALISSSNSRKVGYHAAKPTRSSS